MGMRYLCRKQVAVSIPLPTSNIYNTYNKGTAMRKSLLLLAMCLVSIGTYAQDDDVYFVPSAKDRSSQSNDTYTAPGRSTYSPIQGDDNAYASSDWAAGRGNGGRDVDDYNRRGKNYKGSVLADTLTSQQLYDQGYDDGYEDGSYTARIVRFWSPRAGVCVSSPYYMDYYDLCYDPWYYGYGSPWSWGWSGYWGWGSWYGWRPYYSSWWGWGGWYDPWYYGPYYGYGWGWGGGWYPSHWVPSNAERGPVGGWISYGGRRGSGASYATAAGGREVGGARPSRSFGYTGGGRSAYSNGLRGSNSSWGSDNYRPSRSFGNASRGYDRSQSSRSFDNDRPSRSFNSESRSYSQPSQPSRSFGGGSFSGGSRSSFGGGGSFGGGRNFGGGGGGGRSFGGRR